MPEMKIRENMENFITYGWAHSKLQHIVGAMPTCYRNVMENSLEEGL
jgi:hypothetical protein